MSLLKEPALGFLIYNVSRLLRQTFQRTMVGSELTLAQSRALLYITRYEGIRQVDLANILEVQPITLARLVDQLEAQELVVRKPDPTDRRAHKLYTLPGAEHHLAIIERALQEIRDQFYQGVSQREVDTVFSVLTRAEENLTGNTKKQLQAQ